MATTQATSYDRVPYASVAFSQAHPDRLAAVARIFGLTPPDVDSCRVLELGCASGGHLIPLASNLPRSEFVGLDLSRLQVDEGRADVAALGLANIRLEHASIMDVDRSWGAFDYIICHGVFSWVEAAVQDRILEIAAQHLTPDGVAYVSYNTYPGWHMREMVRHMMRYHVAQFDDPSDQVYQARALLAFLASASDGSSAYGQLLNGEVERLGRAADSYLYHEHLEQTNAPLYFHQFVERAERAGLMYLAESSVSEMLTSHFPPHVAETLERISPDILHLEQYLDFIRNRQFRQTLLCRGDRHPRRRLTPDVLQGLLVSSRATADQVPVDLSPGTAVTFRSGRQRADAVLPASKAAFALLMERWPQAVPVDEVLATALERAAPFLGDTPAAEAARSAIGDLFGGIMYGMVRLHTQAPPCTNTVSETPLAHPVTLYQAQRGPVVVNAHHDNVQLEPLEAAVLRLCDGHHHRSDMAGRLVRRAGGDGAHPGDGRDANEEERQVGQADVDAALTALMRHGVLIR